MNKICVYAICKNESQFVNKWVESMREADYVVVLDTGSTDDTVEKLKAAGVDRVEQKVITPWRFDVARNESMKLIPEDANILVCTDLDEFFDPGWAEALREAWIESEHVEAWYKYAWSHDAEGNPARIFSYNKITSRDWWWDYPVHECLISNYSEEYKNQHILNLMDKIYLHHFPDQTKSRGSYLPLLELRAQEYPDDWFGLFYLSHEYCYRGMYDKSIALLKRLLDEFYDNFSSTEITACYMFLGDDYRALGDTATALTYYIKGITIDKTFRETYLYAAELYNELGLHHCAIGMVEEALKSTYRHYSWLERDSSWKEQVYDILCVAYYGIGDLEQSYTNAIQAHILNPSNSRLLYNKKCVEKALNDKLISKGDS